MLEHGMVVKEMDMVNNIGQMDQYMKDNGKMMKCMVMVE